MIVPHLRAGALFAEPFLLTSSKYYHYLTLSALLISQVQLIGVEAGGEGVDTKKHAATLTKGTPGVLHGSFSYLLQDSEGQIIDPHSISAGYAPPPLICIPARQLQPTPNYSPRYEGWV